MLETFIRIHDAVNGFVWGVPAIGMILGVGLYLTLRTRAVQLRRFPEAMRETIGRIFEKRTAKEGSVTPFQAVCTALAATVGVGNIAGVAGAVALGGPGAVFWIWVSALLGMCTKFAEVTLAVRFRERNAQGDWVGGPMYFIKNGLGRKWLWLAGTFAAFGVLAMLGTGNATQVSSIVGAVNSALRSCGAEPRSEVLNLFIGAALSAAIAVVLLGGIQRIGSVTERLVPFMAILYIAMALGVVLLHWRSLPQVFSSIFQGAFQPRSVTGGLVGSMLLTMRSGVARGIFSNEAGLGTASIAHATADTDSPVRQGLFGIFEVFVASMVICTLTALVILCSGVEVHYGAAAGAELTIKGFIRSYGSVASLLAALVLCCFAFSTILGWGLYGLRCVEYLFGSRAGKPFLIVYSLVAILGATLELELIWNVADTFNALMSIPNLIAVALLSPVVVELIQQEWPARRAK